MSFSCASSDTGPPSSPDPDAPTRVLALKIASAPPSSSPDAKVPLRLFDASEQPQNCRYGDGREGLTDVGAAIFGRIFGVGRERVGRKTFACHCDGQKYCSGGKNSISVGTMRVGDALVIMVSVVSVEFLTVFGGGCAKI